LLAVYVRVDSASPAELEKLEAMGMRVEVVHHDSRRVQGALRPEVVDRLVKLPFVRSVGCIDPPVVRAGIATTEGDAGSRADLVRAQGLDGAGVVVGVISDGIDSLNAAQRTGDLPSVSVPGDPRCRRGSGDEGTATLEIVHDVAPGARLLFAGPGSSLEMIDAVDCLVAAGADVIVDDLAFLGEPFFQDGPVAAAVRAAVQARVSYHSSAGNEADVHLEQDYRQSPSTTFHDFFGGPVDNTDSIIVAPFSAATCSLQWNDPFGGSANDYDLYILDESLAVIAQSTGAQTGTQDPVEVAGVANPSPSFRTAKVVIDKVSGATRRLKLVCAGAGAMEYVTPSGSVFGHPALPEVVAVGAVDAGDPGHDDVESYSARGPSHVYFPRSETRNKPDLVALDGVSISNAGGFPRCPPSCRFFGTSASAPHSAGVAALLLEKNPFLRPAGIQQALWAGAVDLGPPGRDDASGFGRLDAFAAANVVPVPECLEDAGCDDRDACTVDRCPDGRCEHAALGGVDGADCQLGKLLEPSPCGLGQLGQAIQRRVTRARGLLHQAGRTGSPRKFRSLVRRAVKQLQALRRQLDRAVATGRIEASCGSALGQLVGERQRLVEGLRR
jgi:subtilisin family serine protease